MREYISVVLWKFVMVALILYYTLCANAKIYIKLRNKHLIFYQADLDHEAKLVHV